MNSELKMMCLIFLCITSGLFGMNDRKRARQEPLLPIEMRQMGEDVDRLFDTVANAANRRDCQKVCGVLQEINEVIAQVIGKITEHDQAFREYCFARFTDNGICGQVLNLMRQTEEDNYSLLSRQLGVLLVCLSDVRSDYFRVGHEYLNIALEYSKCGSTYSDMGLRGLIVMCQQLRPDLNRADRGVASAYAELQTSSAATNTISVPVAFSSVTTDPRFVSELPQSPLSDTGENVVNPGASEGVMLPLYSVSPELEAMITSANGGDTSWMLRRGMKKYAN